jgi:hypothetical protein
MSCEKCGSKIAPGEFHQCMGPSLHAPWLQTQMELQNAELAKIRELLTIMANGQMIRAENPEAKTRAAKRETRG